MRGYCGLPAGICTRVVMRKFKNMSARKDKVACSLGKLTNVREAPNGVLRLEQSGKCVFKQSLVTTKQVKIWLFDALTGKIIDEFQETEPCRKITRFVPAADNEQE